MSQQYSYTGRSGAAGVSGVLEGANAGMIAQLLRARGITPLRIEAVATEAPASPDVFAGWRSGRIHHSERLLFTRQLHTLLRAGVPILGALAGLQDSSGSGPMKQTLAQVRRSLESGLDLSVALAQFPKVFDTFYVSMVRVGEMTGRLDEVFKRLFEHMEFELFMRQQIKSALRYPMFVIGAMAIAIAVINLMVVPAFAEVFKAFGADLPLATRILVGSSELMIHWGWLIGLGLAGAVMALRQWIKTPAGRLAWDRLGLRLPLAGKIVQKATLARFSRSFALALRSGVPIERALAIVAQTADNAFIASRIEMLREQVERGETIRRSAAAVGIFTPAVLQMIAVGEETGAMDEMMDEVAGIYGNEVQYELKTLSQQIEPILVMFLGAVVLVLALGVFLPMWDLGRVALKK